MVNAWISLKLKPADLQKVYEKNVLKGRKVILQKYDELLKGQIFWKDHKFWKNLPLYFDVKVEDI